MRATDRPTEPGRHAGRQAGGPQKHYRKLGERDISCPLSLAVQIRAINRKRASANAVPCHRCHAALNSEGEFVPWEIYFSAIFLLIASRTAATAPTTAATADLSIYQSIYLSACLPACLPAAAPALFATTERERTRDGRTRKAT